MLMSLSTLRSVSLYQESKWQVTVAPIFTLQEYNVAYALLQLKFTTSHDLCIKSLNH